MTDFSFHSFRDESLVDAAKGGNIPAMEELVIRMLPFIRSVAVKASQTSGLDTEDLTQEGLIGLLSAIRTFDCSREASFRTYAGVCFSNSIRSAVKKTRTLGNIPDNAVVPIDDISLFHSDSLDDPQDIIVGNEEVVRLRSIMDKHLSEAERNVLRLYLNGDSYRVIAEKLSLSGEKAVDNALQRIRKKLKSFS